MRGNGAASAGHIHFLKGRKLLYKRHDFVNQLAVAARVGYKHAVKHYIRIIGNLFADILL